MNCPYCQHETTNVIESRSTTRGQRRRRECSNCGRRFTTYETVRTLDVKVVKRDGSEEKFSRNKIRNGIEKAAEKTDLEETDTREIISDVISRLETEKKVESTRIGALVKEELRKRNEVAAIRFASVYENFEEAESFQKEVETMKQPQGDDD